MGDYVAKPSKAAKDDSQPLLFDSFEDISHPLESDDSEHQPITDFSIYVEVDMPSEMKCVVDKWVQYHGSKYLEPTTVVAEGGNQAGACCKLRCAAP